MVASYVYDAWGNCKVCNPDGTENTSSTFIGNINPFRYRGYYYDVETGLYYLQSRYYDPETGRFINADTIDYLDPESINGLNLYAYCGNNPVMYTDSTGTNWWIDFWNSTAGRVVGTILVVAAVVALTVATAGVGTAITAALGSGLIASAVGGAIGGALTGAVIGVGLSMVSQGVSGGYGNIDYSAVGMSAMTGAISGAIGGLGGGLIGTMAFGGAADVVGGFMSGDITSFGQAIKSFALGAVLSAISFGAGKAGTRFLANKKYTKIIGNSTKNIKINGKLADAGFGNLKIGRDGKSCILSMIVNSNLITNIVQNWGSVGIGFISLI